MEQSRCCYRRHSLREEDKHGKDKESKEEQGVKNNNTCSFERHYIIPSEEEQGAKNNNTCKIKLHYIITQEEEQDIKNNNLHGGNYDINKQHFLRLRGSDLANSTDHHLHMPCMVHTVLQGKRGLLCEKILKAPPEPPFRKRNQENY